jgi:hypothetical protein
MFRVIAVALVACGWIALVPSGAAAAPIAYYESFSGDLVSNQAPLTTFAFEAGVNTIDGMLGSSDFDAFAFVVPAGHQLAAGRVRLFNGPGGGSTITGVDWTFNAGSASPTAGASSSTSSACRTAPTPSSPRAPRARTTFRPTA